ncbi:MAG: hypothetical protein JJV94_01915 [Sulfurospirillum sp.]|nr:hypothetical protein [Sulfurospirillum sp.]
MKFIFMSLIILASMSFGADEILASCSNSKSELLDLRKGDTKGYSKDSVIIDLIIRGKKIYAKSNTSESELTYLGGNQFLEQVNPNNNVLYTYFKKSKILTIQKSYDMLGPIMVNMYLECK